MVRFADLSEDILLEVFFYLDPADLFAVSCLNVGRLKKLVDYCLSGETESLLITGSECFTHTHLDDRLRIHSNWINGNYKVCSTNRVLCLTRPN